MISHQGAEDEQCGGRIALVARAPRSRSLFLEPHFFVVPRDSDPAYGGGLGLSGRIAGPWMGLVSGRFRTTHRDDEGLRVRTFQALLGLGPAWHSRYWGMELRSGFALGWTEACVRPRPPRVEDSAGRWVPGVFAEALLLVAPRRSISGQFGAVLVGRSATRIQIDGATERREGPVELGVSMGLRIRWDLAD